MKLFKCTYATLKGRYDLYLIAEDSSTVEAIVMARLKERFFKEVTITGIEVIAQSGRLSEMGLTPELLIL